MAARRKVEFQIRHRVYDREGKKCFRRGAKIRSSIAAGRRSYFYAKCQPIPRSAMKRRKK